MYDENENVIYESEHIKSTSNKFYLNRIGKLPGNQESLNIITMVSSKKYIYILTDKVELFCLESSTLRPVEKTFFIKPNDKNESSIIKKFKENFSKIWTDREGNHGIIRSNNKIYYFNINCSEIKELNIFKGIEICAVSFDDCNKDDESTGNFLATDYDNNIYECSISIKIEKNGDYTINDIKKNVSIIIIKDWDSEEDEDINERKPLKNDRIYGIKFVKTLKQKLNPNDNVFYIIAATRTRLYQLIGTGELGFKQMFEKYNQSPILFNDCCKYFPPDFKKKNKVFNTELNILYREENKILQFGWKTETGFCFGNYSNYSSLPHEVKKFTVIPFAKITSYGNKEICLEPISITHTKNHIFTLFDDCLTIISKITSNIIDIKYFKSEYTGVIYNEFSSDEGDILLYSKNGLYQISLNNENKEIWKDYIEIGDYSNALLSCGKNERLKRRINRINADELYEKKDAINSPNKYVNSDEKFENVYLKYLMNDQLEPLNIYLELYLGSNIGNSDNYKIESNIISTLLVELFLNKTKQKEKEKSSLEEFRQLIREYNKYFKGDNIIYELLQSYGRMEEYVEYASIMGDFEKVILYHINQNDIKSAIEKLTWFASFTDDKNALKTLSDIFLENCHIFFKKNPKESISLLQQRFKEIDMEVIVQAIMSSTDKDKRIPSKELKDISASKAKLSENDDNSQVIVNFLKYLVEKPKLKQTNNIHNLYIYYLSKNSKNQNAILEYLKGPLKSENNNYSNKKNQVLFQLDYAKKLFKNNPPAYALVLANMGKFSEGVKVSLIHKTEECQEIAKFIASNAPGEKLRKKLWLEIFSCNSQNEFQEALKIMKESKILKIEDVLPHITDTIKIEDFKKQISNCINDYEDNIKKLKEDINDYNKTAENIKNDIEKVKKKSMDIQYSSCKCEICQGYIKDKNIFIFPCGHMFDANCIRECLLEYEMTGLDYIHENNVKIDQLFFDLGYIKQKSFTEPKAKKEENENEEKKQQEEQQAKTGIFFSKIKVKPGPKKPEEVVEYKPPQNPQALKDELNAILSQQCVLCGDFMVDCVQFPICKPEKMEVKSDGRKIKIFDLQSWDYTE